MFTGLYFIDAFKARHINNSDLVNAKLVFVILSISVHVNKFVAFSELNIVGIDLHSCALNIRDYA